MGSSGPFISSSGGFLRAGRLLVFAAALIGIIFSTSLIVRINAAGATWYVDDATCPATGNGTLQTPYCKIQDAICAAMSGDLVSVAPGTYPESIRMRPNVDVVSQSGALLTTINGAGQPCSETNFCTKRTGQCSTVIFGSGHTTATLLDGFTITGGSGFVTTTPNQVAGGGIYVFSSSTISNNIIRDNFLSSSQQNFFGGGIFIASGAPVITNNIISGNRAIPGPGAGKSPTAGYGAGIYVAFYSAPVIIENLIENNDAGDANTAISVGGGGGIAIFPGTGSDVIVDRNIIADNYAADLGGGIHIIGKNGAVANPIITNNVVVGNVCPFEGGGIYVAYIGARIVNNTIRDNAGMRGGGIQTGGGDPNLPIVITNNIIEGNRITDLGGQAGGIFAYSPLSSFLPTISETDIWGNQGAEVDGDLTEAQVIGVNGNFSADPLFADPNARDFHLDPNSPAIDVGTTSGAPAVDFDNNLRGVDGDGTPDSPQVGDIDVGAFEVQGGCSTLPEVCDNLDNNCDGTTDDFPTACGVGQCASTGTCTAGSNSCVPGTPSAEICDKLDNNCDGTTDSFATSCGIGQCARTGTCTAGSNSCAPGAPAAEICDNLDNNCDGTTDSFATSCGIGQCARTGTCTAGSNSCTPGAPAAEVCDNLDNNCDGATDEGFPDSDGDMLNDCLDPDDDNDGAADAGDCAPLNAGSFGFPTEVLNLSPAAGPPTTLSWTVQNIGAATTYEIHSGLLSRMKITESLGESFCLSASSPTSPFTDTRGNPPPGDGYLYLIRSFNACGAATFGDPNRDLPRSLNACSGGIVDGDADGSPSDLDCNDANPGISPLATELCDNVDNNCDATTDSFATTCGLGQCVAAGTCTAGSDSCTPGAPSVEICDNMDNNCDGTTDVFATTCGVGECVASGTCVRGLNMCAPGTPAAELCDGLDNSCDAVTDEGFGVGTTCDGVGTCGVGVRECAGTGGTRCSTEPGGSADQSVPEVCDNLDNNCDGTTDSFATSCGLGQCARTGTCTAGSNSCAPGAPSTEVCDGLDNDCDGATDDGVLNACGACGALAPDASCNGVDDNCNGVTDEACCTAVSATLSQHEAAGRAHVVNESCGTTPVQVFADNFESGNLSQWSPLIGAPTVTSTPTDVISGTFSAWFSSVGAEGVRKTVNTSGLTNVTLSYKRRSRSMEATDSFTVRWSTNGGSSWTNLEVVTGTYGITTRSFALPAASSLLLSFEATLSSATGDHAFLDDVVVSGDMPCVQPTWYATGSNQLLGTNPAMTVVLNERPIGSGMWRTGGCPTCLGEDLTCDGVDDDCNGVPDDAFDVGTACDGVGACGAGVRECSSPAASRCSTDPGGTQDQSIPETCDAVDNDCDGVADDGFTDSDLDGQADCTDPDDDNDGAIDVIDCAPLNATAFAQPTAVADVMATGQGPTNLTWMTQSAGSGTLYDVTTGDFAAIGGISYPAGSCLASTTSGFTTDAGPNPALGSVTYYLVRARNVCGISSYGSAGRDTSPSCP